MKKRDKNMAPTQGTTTQPTVVHKLVESKRAPTHRMPIVLPAEIHEQLQAIAAYFRNDKLSLNEIVNDAVREYMRKPGVASIIEQGREALKAG